jgi:hypothetical protein
MIVWGFISSHGVLLHIIHKDFAEIIIIKGRRSLIWKLRATQTTFSRATMCCFKQNPENALVEENATPHAAINIKKEQDTQM